MLFQVSPAQTYAGKDDYKFTFWEIEHSYEYKESYLDEVKQDVHAHQLQELLAYGIVN